MSKLLLSNEASGLQVFWRKLEASDCEEVIKIILEQWITREILCSTLQVSKEDATSWILEDCRRLIENKQSICAYDGKTGNICALALASIYHNGMKTAQAEQHELPPKKAKIFRFLQFLTNDPDDVLQAKIGVEKCIRGERMCIHRDYQQFGIATALSLKHFEFAREQGYRYFFTECTSAYSAKMCENIGFVCLKEVVYADYEDPVTGEKVFANAPYPHTKAKLMLKDLLSSNI